MKMVILLSRAAGVALTIWFVWTQVWPRVRARIPDDFQKLSGPERVARAREVRSSILGNRFRAAGLKYPPREIFLRAFKHEAQLEAWVRGDGDTFSLIHSYPITYSPGKPGPKRREGDRQVPEGFYTIDVYNPLSLFHLSLRINYPNESDRILSDRNKPGFDIYVHGGDGSVGCLPVGDDGIEEIYLMALDAGNRGTVPIHIFPARMSGAEWEEFVAPFRLSDPDLVKFWEQLQPGYEVFERTRRLPRVAVEKDGRYRVDR